ncbi:hypothetical protein [Parabacteroides faecis]|uniref:hypothetical protein n=1 Tax=Parabacteroides faecis TaxID=1217282 RepID=UPI0035216E06
MNFDYGLLAKYLADNISSDEMQEMLAWGNLSPDNKTILSDVMRLRVSYHSMYYKSPDRIEEALGKVNGKIDRSNRFQLMRNVLQYAAVFLVLVSCFYGGYEYFQPEKQICIVVKPGQDVKKVMLADGTCVWLKGGSTLKYPVSFSDENRQVSLQGEAFFEVSKKAGAVLAI